MLLALRQKIRGFGLLWLLAGMAVLALPHKPNRSDRQARPDVTPIRTEFINSAAKPRSIADNAEPSGLATSALQQDGPSFANSSATIAFQNAGGFTVGHGVSIAFQNAGSVAEGRGISIAFSSCPISANTVVPASARVNEPVPFLATVTSSQCPGTPAYSWDFNVGSSKSTLANPKHIYTTPGTFTWNLTITFANSSQITKSGVISISNVCEAPKTAKPVDGSIIIKGRGATLKVSANGTAPLNYQWYRGVSGDTSVPLLNATGSTYTTESLTVDTSYWVEIRNECGQIQSNTAVVTIAGNNKIEIQAVDPNCDGIIHCQGAYLKKKSDQSDEVVIDTSKYDKLADARVFRSEVVADGVTLLLLRVRSESKVRFYMTQFPFRGELMTLDGSVKGGDITVEPVGKIAFAAFRAPIDNLAQGVYINVLSDAGTNKKWIPFRKPPVVLVHGVWSDNTAWKGLAEKLRQSRFDVCKECLPDYGTRQPAGSFDPFAIDENDRYVIRTLITATRQALMSLRWQGIAVTQVDVVGHSMGGLVARARVASSFDSYYKLNNYWKGDFHKIITVGSPHKGTTLANWLVQHWHDELSFRGKILDMDDNTLGGLLAVQGRPFGPAILGFQTTSEAIRNIGGTPVNSHAIIGKAPLSPFTSDTEENLNWLMKSRISYRTGESVDGILGNEDHDTIVPVDSQQGGLPDTAKTSIDGIVHADVEPFDKLSPKDDVIETSSTEVWDKIIKALTAPILDGNTKTTTFSFFPPFSNNLPEQTTTSAQPFPSKAPETKRQVLPEKIISVSLTPSQGTIVHPGEVIQINFDTPVSSSIEGAMFVSGKQFVRVTGAGPFSLSFVVPTTQTGRVDIQAATYGSGQEVFQSSTYVMIEPRSPLTLVEVSPASLVLPSLGDKYQLRVTGHYSTESRVDMTFPQSGTSYSVKSGNSKVITISSDGEIEAKGEGKDEVIVSNSGKTVSVPVYVATSAAPVGSEAVSVSAASYDRASIATESIIAMFGSGLATATQAAVTQPLPVTLAGTSILVKDNTGTERLAPLLFVSPAQINFQVPAGTAPGIVSLSIIRPGDIPASDTFESATVSPSIFSADASGRGLAAAQALRVKSDNSQTYEPVSKYELLQNTFVATPIDLGPASDQVYLILYGTGIRYHSGLANVKATIGGVDAPVEYAGAQGGFVGLDQVNIRLPRSLAGRGEVDIVLTVDGKTANTVKVNIK